MTDTLTQAIQAAIFDSKVETSPYRHAMLHDFLPLDTLWEVIYGWPEEGWHELVHPDQLKPDGTYRRRQQRVSEAFPHLGQVLESPQVTAAFFSLFNLPPPKQCFPQALLLDDEPGYWIRPHPDTGNKQITVQVYLADDMVHDYMGTWLGDRFCPYYPNAGFCFPVSGNTVHEVKPNVCDARRRSIQILHYNSPSPGIRYVA